MHSFRILDADVSADLADWEKAWLAWPDREVFGHPSYGDLFRAHGDRLFCASVIEDSGGILFPFIVRPLSREKCVKGHGELWDAVNPYGYGGPFTWGTGLNRADDFWKAFGEWAKEFGLVSLFARLSLFPDQMVHFDGDVRTNAPNVIRTLDLTEEALWYDYEHKVRKNVKRAKNCGLFVEEDPVGRDLSAFLDVYHSTLNRRDASSNYYFDGGFFKKIVERLPGQFMLFHVRDGRSVVSTELVLVSKDNIYSFLGGTRSDSFKKRPNDLLKHEVIRWGMRYEKKNYVLGGGYSGLDGIFKYKLSFAPNGEVPFRIGRRIDLPERYDELVGARNIFEANRGHRWQPSKGFFPAYRS
jgi:hypothetical protein